MKNITLRNMFASNIPPTLITAINWSKVNYLWTTWHHYWAPRHHVLVTSAMVSLVETLVLLLVVMALRLPRSKCHTERTSQLLSFLQLCQTSFASYLRPSFCFKKQMTQIYSNNPRCWGHDFFQNGLKIETFKWIENEESQLNELPKLDWPGMGEDLLLT